MATRIMLDFTATDNSLPRVRELDPIVTDGSMMLVDFTNPGMPSDWLGVSTGYVPNLAWGTLGKMIGGGTEQGLAATYVNNLDAGDGTMERTSQGGLHGIIKNGIEYTGQRSAALTSPAVRGWMTDNPGHSYFASVWGAYTRDDGRGDNGSSRLRMAGFNRAGGHELLTLRRAVSGIGIQPTTNRIGSRAKPSRDPGQMIVNAGYSQMTGAPSADSFAIWTTGNGGNTIDEVAMPSWALYRFYLEDLTVSGRTYAAADAEDNAAYSAEVLSTGGRYNGDTWTNPTNLA